MKKLVVLSALLVSPCTWATTGLQNLPTLKTLMTGASGAGGPSAAAPTPTPTPSTLKPVRMLKGHYDVIREWPVKNPDGSFSVTADTPCSVDVQIPYYEFKIPETSTPDGKDMVLGTCKSTTNDGSPVELTIVGLVGTGPSEDGGTSTAMVGAFTTAASSSTNTTGGFGVFTTKSALKDGQLLIPSQGSFAILKETVFSASLKFEDQP